MSLLRRNIVVLVFSQMATWLVSVVLLILAPGKLDSEGYGRLQFVGAFVGFFALVGSLGTFQYIVKAVARDQRVVASLVRSALRLKLALGAALLTAAVLLGWILGYRGEVLVLIAIGCLSMVLAMLNDMVVAGLTGMEQMARPAAWQTVQVYLGTAAAVTVLLTNKSLILYALGNGLAVLAPLAANYRLIRPYLRAEPRATQPWRPMIVGGVPLLLLMVLNVVYGTIDIPILNSVSGSVDVAWYSVAYRWVGMPIFITTIVVTAFLPSLSALARTSAAAFAALTNRALRLVVFVTIPASIGLMFVSADLMDLLYGDKYDRSAVLIQILAIHVPLVALDTVLATALIAADRQNRYVLVAGAAALFNPPLAFLAIRISDGRYDNGAIGASITTVLTETFIMCCALRMRPAGVIDRGTVGFFARVAGAAAAMVVVLLLFRNSGLFVKVGVGAIAFGLGSVGLRTVSVARVKGLLSDIRAGRSGHDADTNDGGSDEMSDTGVEQ